MKPIFQVIKAYPLPEWIQVLALFKDGDKILKDRAFFLGKVQEMDDEIILNTFISPIIFEGGVLECPLGVSNFESWEISYSKSKGGEK